MAYQFAGFFAQPAVSKPLDLPANAVWREITSPFAGVGVRLPDLIGSRPAVADVESLASQLGLEKADRWLYLIYVCWGGTIDFVYGVGSSMGTRFGPFEESALDRVERVYTELMGSFGVSPTDALQFPPFIRGYWGDV